MVNVRGTRKALETALVGQDPQRLAKVFELPIDCPSSKSGEPRKHNPQALAVDGKDYGTVLTGILDYIAGAEVVSQSFSNVFQFRNHQSPFKLAPHIVFFHFLHETPKPINPNYREG